jgi:hypothetical protein
VDVSIWKTISGCAISVLGLVLFSFPCFAVGPHLEFYDGKVWMKDLDPEILYTFSRYYNATDEWKAVFPITLRQTPDVVVDGQYEVFKSAVCFTPRFPFASNLEYEAIFYQEALSNNYNEVYLPKAPSNTLRLIFSISTSNEGIPMVTNVYPTADVLPENLLKLHITFSQSMTRGEVYERVKIYDVYNKAIEKAFLIVDEELWDEEMKSITIMLDPGRVKRGLRANLEMGAPLHAEESYTLVIDKGWPDQFGNRTTNIVKKHFTCIAADRKKPDAQQWSFCIPTNRDSPLTIDLKESFDIDLLLHTVRIKDKKGNLIRGTTSILDHETKLIFENDGAWKNGDYTIEINPVLEDLAGNNMKRLFDKDNRYSENDTPVLLQKLEFSIFLN